MNSDNTNPQGPHVAAQVAAAWAAFDKEVRAEQLHNSLQDLNEAFSSAMSEVQNVRDFVGSPESILGNQATKHGEIAEQVHVGVKRAFDVLHGRMPSATFEGVGRLDPIDYRVNGIDIQAKYINGLKNTLDHVLDHAEKYPDFAKGNSQYHIANDQYEQLRQLEATGKIEGLSDRTSQTIQKKIEELRGITGRETKDLIQPGEASYSEAQQGKIPDTIESRENRLAEDRDKLRETARTEHGPSIQGFGQAAVLGAAAGGGVRLTQALWVKWREGKNPFRGDFSASDWKDLGIEGAKGAGGGAIAGGTLYLLTNATDLAAPFAGAMVSGLMGIGDLLRQYHSGKINGAQFTELSLLVASDAAIVGLATAAGQALIPIPLLGAFLGSIAGKLVASALKNGLGNSEGELITRLENYETLILEKLDSEYRSVLSRLDQYFGNLEQLLKLSFDEALNTSLRLDASVRLAESFGIPEPQIIRSTDNLDQFMME